MAKRDRKHQNFTALVEFLQQKNPGKCQAISVDVEDLFYSILHDELMRSVRMCICDFNDEHAFFSSCKVPLESFLELVSFYLKSIYVHYNEELYLQRRGICIGSRVAPVLCEIFLSFVDRKLAEGLEGLVKHVFRYVNDYLVLFDICDCCRHSVNILKVFRENGSGLNFTVEMMTEGTLQFLDLKLDFLPTHVCWRYHPRSLKPLLDFTSHHSKLIKQGIAFSCVRSALQKSCQDGLHLSFSEQVARLKQAGFPEHTVAQACEKMRKRLKPNGSLPGGGEERTTRAKKYTVIPYTHRVAHGLKNVAQRYDVDVVFSFPHKLESLCAKVQKSSDTEIRDSGNVRGKCGINHTFQYTECKEAIVYQIPLSCGKSYIGQSGRCVNIRLREHERSLSDTKPFSLAAHCKQCGCTPFFADTMILSRHRQQMAREVIEAFHIQRRGEKCISLPSIALSDAEFQYLSGTCR